MSLFELFSIAIALSLDAFGVAISIGLKYSLNASRKILTIVSFGFFQFFLSAIGLFIGTLFNQYVFNIPDFIGGLTVMIIGVLMIHESIQNKQESIIMKPGIFIILGISVSIDALMVGFTVISKATLIYAGFVHTIFIGLITLLMTIIAFFTAKHLKRIELIEKYSQHLGGVILILFGIKMLLFSRL